MPHSDGAALAWLYRHGEVVERRDDESAAHLMVRLDAADAPREGEGAAELTEQVGEDDDADRRRPVHSVKGGDQHAAVARPVARGAHQRGRAAQVPGQFAQPLRHRLDDLPPDPPPPRLGGVGVAPRNPRRRRSIQTDILAPNGVVAERRDKCAVRRAVVGRDRHDQRHQARAHDDRFADPTFLPTGAGAHGLYVSRDSQHLYITNRGAGTISVLDFATNTISATWTWREQHRNQARVVETLRELRQVDDVLSTVKDAETGQRGFLLTGAERYLEPYTAAKARLPSALQRLRQTAGRGPRELQRIDALAATSAARQLA